MQIGLSVLVVIVLLAWIKGGLGERAGSMAVAVAWIGSLALQPLTPEDYRPLMLLSFDFALAVALLITAFRYPSFWLGAALMLQAFVLAVHAFHLEGEAQEEGLRRAYVIVLNLSSYGLLLALAASTIAVWLRRNRVREGDRRALPTASSAA